VIKDEKETPMKESDLEQLVKEKDIQGLIQALMAEDRHVRIAAVRALGNIGDERAVKPLITVASTDKDCQLDEVQVSDEYALYSYPIRTMALEALGNLVARITDRAIPPIIALHKTGKDWSRITNDLLVRIGSPTVEPLLAALNHPDFSRQIAAIETLGDIGDQRAVEPLIKILSGKKKAFSLQRDAAAEALGKIRDKRADGTLIAPLGDVDAIESK
jgi:HEAT repeat protein